eukprot:CAMPEP_0117003108 /NCGR_PEP_ID=MMETSP0472-20121206/4535_1 /TAXON_ID=693140 ORGANISM="Tiarina fusus, Strain LIS" /NCGR_SAMPLE_ID=MMETSP0472 /ASSEMBLY_ACC=CAM_ASM_000603 /LENGTH=279 /DNA_ID=CAMNT_0004703641 /DNA_START=764 /DNA_END=1603 /DNA_ORIENTATION=+
MRVKVSDNFCASERATLRASQLENEPGKVESWRKLVAELGVMLGVSRGHATIDRRHRVFCNQCKCLRNPLFVDHDALSKRKSDESWWGRNRDWWVPGLLQVACRTSPRATNRKTAAVVARVKELMPKLPHLENIDADFVDDAVPRVSTSHLSWLPRDSSGADTTSKSVEDRSESYGLKLPQSYFKASDGSCNETVQVCHSLQVELPSFSGPNARYLEIFCYKVVILCHLRDLDKIWLDGFIRPVILACWNKVGVDENCDEFYALLWLCEIGLDVPHLAK